MNLGEDKSARRSVWADRTAESLQPVGPVRSLWLTCYPIFQDALRHGETTFRMLPQSAKFAAINHVFTDSAEQIIASAILDDIRVAYVELSTPCVVEAAERFFVAPTTDSTFRANASCMSLCDLALQIPFMNYPSIARPPCVLRPGVGIFLNSWMRFFGYWTRGDRTIPLLAVDWPNFFERLESGCR